MRRLAALLPLVPALAAAGCGGSGSDEPTATATTTTATPRAGAFVTQRFPADGVRFDRPAGWDFARGSAPLLATISAGRVTIAVWRYPRAEALPATLPELTRAKDALVAAARARDPSFKVRKAKGTRAARSPAVVIVADETVAGEPRTVRSTHVYAHGGEVVVDAFAPPGEFSEVEDPVFRRVVRTLRVTAPAGR